MLTAGLQKFRLLFGLDEKQWKRTFSAKKISILRNIWQKALVISWWKKNAVHNNC